LDLQKAELEVLHVLTVLDWRGTVGFERIDSIGFRTNFFNMAVLNFDGNEVFGCKKSPVNDIEKINWKLETEENCDLCCKLNEIIKNDETSDSVICIGSNHTNITNKTNSFDTSIKNSTLIFSSVSINPETSFAGGELTIKLTNTNNEKLYSQTGSPVASLKIILNKQDSDFDKQIRQVSTAVFSVQKVSIPHSSGYNCPPVNCSQYVQTATTEASSKASFEPIFDKLVNYRVSVIFVKTVEGSRRLVVDVYQNGRENRFFDEVIDKSSFGFGWLDSADFGDTEMFDFDSAEFVTSGVTSLLVGGVD